MSSSFAYRAAQAGGIVERGVLTAETAADARAALSARGLFALELRDAGAHPERRPGLPADDLALGLRTLSTLIGAGLPLTRALAAMDELAPPSWGSILPDARDAIRAGQSLGTALETGPVALPAVVVGLIRAGEGGSGLPAALSRAAQLSERAAASRRALRGALAYPALLAGAGTLSVAVLVVFVLPRFAAILTDLGQELPPTTSTVLGAADLVRRGWLPALLTAAVTAVTWRSWVATAGGRLAWHTWLLEVPLLGRIRRSSGVSRFAAALAALLENGVPIASALSHASRATGDAALEQRIEAARNRVVSGETLGLALEAEFAATPTTIRLLRAGEEAGRLSAMLDEAANIESEVAESAMRAAMRALEPVLVIAFGACVAMVAAALLQAVYSVRPGG
jgi:type II secretory pathway component PulF